jgi:phage FluMu gp28-like protein
MLPNVGDANFAAAPMRQLPGALVPLPAYQFQALLSHARIEVWKWCRQSGKDFTASLKATLHALQTHQPWFIVSLTERQALSTFDKVKMHCRALGVALADLRLVEGEQGFYSHQQKQWCTVKTKSVILPGGGSITALPGADPDALAGLTGNLIFTEFALAPDEGREHWRVLFPLITRGFKIIVISTPRGSSTTFAMLCRNARGKYLVSTVDIHRALADGLQLTDEEGRLITAEELFELYSDPAGWEREYLCKESDELDSLVEWRYLEAAKMDYSAIRLSIDRVEQYNPAYENVFAQLPRGKPHFLGWDVARKGDLSAIAVHELVGDLHILRALIIMHRMDFAYMRAVVKQGMDRGLAGAGDATGMGMDSCETLGKDYPGMFAEVNFTSSKGALGAGLMQTFQDVRYRMPREGFDDYVHDLHAIQKERRDGKLILHETQNPVEKRSHCDMAYACALALHAAKDYSECWVMVA